MKNLYIIGAIAAVVIIAKKRGKPLLNLSGSTTTVPVQSGASTAAYDSAPAGTTDSNGTLSNTNAPKNGDPVYYASSPWDAAASPAAMIRATNDGAHADDGVFIFA